VKLSPAQEKAFDYWLALGMSQGWCSEVSCGTHEGIPESPEERTKMDEGDDLCMRVVRLWPDRSES